MANACKALLKIIESSQYKSVEKFRIEVRKEKDKHVIVLRIPTDTWYETQGINVENEVVRLYILKLRQLSRQVSPAIISNEHPINVKPCCETPNPALCKYCIHPSKCNKIHPRVYCKAKNVPRKDGTGGCNWKIHDELRIDSNDKYILSARKEATRDLLLCPLSHCSNKDFVVLEDTWREVLARSASICKYDRDGGVELIAVNFGKWETEQSLDDMALNCHAHIHIIISPAALEGMSGNVFAVKGRYFRPETYYESEANSIEPRIMYKEYEKVGKKFDILEANVVKMNSRMDNVDRRLDGMDKRFDNMENRMNSMENRMDKMEKRFDERMDKMENRMDKMDNTMNKILSILENKTPV